MSEPERGRGGTATALALAFGGLFMTLVFYVASLGPVVMLCGGSRCRDIEPVLRAVYAPLLWLHDETPLERPLDWYVELWEN